MLRGLKIKNAYSIKELDMSFIKGKYGYKKEMVNKNIVSPITIYGNNGSGKSSVVNALNDLVNLLISDKEKFYPLIANFNNKSQESEIELVFNVEEDEYKYSLKTSFLDSNIKYEALFINNVVVFTRNENRTIIEDKEYEVNDGLFLSIRELYSRIDELKENKKVIKIAYDYLTNICVIKGDNSICNSKLLNFKNVEKLMVENNEEIKRVLSNYEGMQLFDYFNDNDSDYLNIYSKSGKSFRLPGFLISDGMFTLTKILSILINLDSDSLLVIDGVERNLHPSAIVFLINEARKKEIQLLFTSHNTSLMQEFRPDQIYFARWKNGYSYYFRLSGIYENIREINNIEKMYLSNTFDEAINEIINIEQ